MRTASPSYGIEMNSVLRNTYMLLSMTLVFSAITAYFGTQVTFSSPLFLGVFIGAVILMIATFFLRNSPMGLVTVFGFTGLMGFALGPTLTHYLKMPGGGMLVAMAAGLTAAIFIGLSLYVLVTGKDFSFMGGMLFTALLALVLAGFIGLFFHAPVMQLALAVISVIVFSGYVLYDTSTIIHGGETNYIVATVSLYLDILNLFVNLLRILNAILSFFGAGIGSSDD
jgi:modulator of FtsH protease